MKKHRYKNSFYIFILILVCNFFIQNSSYAKHESNPSPKISVSFFSKDNVSIAKDLVQVAFFFVLGYISIMSYNQAKKTLFTPIKTETFKLQLRLFEDLLSFFEKHQGARMQDIFDLEKMLNLNTFKMYDFYARSFFKGKIELNEEITNKKYEDLVGGIVSKEYMETNFELIDTHLTKDKSAKKAEVESPAAILAKWKKYEHGIVEYTKKFRDASEKLRYFIASPILPVELKDLIKKFEIEVHDSTTLIGKVLTEVSQEMPDKYPTAETLVKADITWIWNKYNHKGKKLDEVQTEILEYINKYLDVENIIK